MIEKLILRNYGPYEDNVIEFDKDATAIIGDNGSGKTFIINALKTLLCNKSIKAEDIRHGAESATITVVLDSCSITKSYDRKTHKTRVTTVEGTKEFIGVKGFDEYVLPLTKCGETVVGKVVIDNTFVGVTEQILPYINSPKDLLVAIAGPYASVDFKTIATKFDTRLRKVSQIVTGHKANIAVLDKYIDIAEELDKKLEEVEKELAFVNKMITQIINKIVNIRTVGLLDKITELDTAIKGIDSEIRRVNQRLSMLQTKTCPTCNRPL